LELFRLEYLSEQSKSKIKIKKTRPIGRDIERRSEGHATVAESKIEQKQSGVFIIYNVLFQPVADRHCATKQKT
jgi:hypothetical protein